LLTTAILNNATIPIIIGFVGGFFVQSSADYLKLVISGNTLELMYNEDKKFIKEVAKRINQTKQDLITSN